MLGEKKGDVSASGGVVRDTFSIEGERALQTTNSSGYHVHLPSLVEGEVRGSDMEV